MHPSKKTVGEHTFRLGLPVLLNESLPFPVLLPFIGNCLFGHVHCDSPRYYHLFFLETAHHFTSMEGALLLLLLRGSVQNCEYHNAGHNSSSISDIFKKPVCCCCHQKMLTACESVMTAFGLCVFGLLIFLSTVARLALRSPGTQVNPALLHPIYFPLRSTNIVAANQSS